MKKTRIDFDNELRKILGSDNVYFSPPESVKLKYPCFVYQMDPYQLTKADNRLYLYHTKYSVTLIEKDPDSEEFKSPEKFENEEANSLIQRVLFTFPLCSHNRRFTSDNLNHDVFTIYY